MVANKAALKSRRQLSGMCEWGAPAVGPEQNGWMMCRIEFGEGWNKGMEILHSRRKWMEAVKQVQEEVCLL